MGAIHKDDKNRIDRSDCRIQSIHGGVEIFPLRGRTEDDKMYLYQRFIESTKRQRQPNVEFLIPGNDGYVKFPNPTIYKEKQIKLSFNPKALFAAKPIWKQFYVLPKKPMPNQNTTDMFFLDKWQTFRRNVYTHFIRHINFNPISG
mgnify:FL=1